MREWKEITDEIAEKITAEANRACTECQDFDCYECEYRYWVDLNHIDMNKDDLINRQAVPEAQIIRNRLKDAESVDLFASLTEEDKRDNEMYIQGYKDALEDNIKHDPEQTRVFVELVVEYPDPELCTYKEYKGKPYYSIKYIENGETYVGYGTYNPEVLSQYLKEYFISSAQPEIIHCRDCKYGRCDIFDRGMWCELDPSFDPPSDDWFCADAERRTDEPD